MDLPNNWLSLFDGTGLEDKLHVSALIATVDELNRPHLAFLSAGEVLVWQPRRIAVALWPTSRSTANFRRIGHATLYGVADGSVWEVRLHLKRQVSGEWALFDTDVETVTRHTAPYAEVTGLVGFRLVDPVSATDRWRKQITMLREFAKTS